VICCLCHQSINEDKQVPPKALQFPSANYTVPLASITYCVFSAVILRTLHACWDSRQLACRRPRTIYSSVGLFTDQPIQEGHAWPITGRTNVFVFSSAVQSGFRKMNFSIYKLLMCLRFRNLLFWLFSKAMDFQNLQCPISLLFVNNKLSVTWKESIFPWARCDRGTCPDVLR
jgi:hypothetical protein